MPDRIYPNRLTSIGVTAVDANGVTFYNWGNTAETAIFTVESSYTPKGQHTTPAGLWTGGAVPDGCLWGAVNHVVIGNTDVETSLMDVPGCGSKIIPANWFTPGRAIQYRCRGFITTGNAQESTFAVKLGGVTLVTNTGVLPNNLTNMYVEAIYDIACHASGQAGVVEGAGRTMIQMASGINTIAMRSLVGADVVFDTRAAAAVDVTYKWTTAAAGNVVTITHSNIRVIS
jgi:hypothetical protein